MPLSPARGSPSGSPISLQMTLHSQYRNEVREVDIPSPRSFHLQLSWYQYNIQAQLPTASCGDLQCLRNFISPVHRVVYSCRQYNDIQEGSPLLFVLSCHYNNTHMQGQQTSDSGCTQIETKTPSACESGAILAFNMVSWSVNGSLGKPHLPPQRA